MPVFAYISRFHGITNDWQVWWISEEILTIKCLDSVHRPDVMAGRWAGIEWTPVEQPSLENE